MTTPSYGSSAATALPTLSGYRIVGELGRGGMGVVYRAVQEVLGRQVAIKAMTVDPAMAQQLLERFIQEARIIAHMGSNENIVQVYDVARDSSGSFFIVMEYVEGLSLAQRIRNGPPITLGQTIKLMVSILTGLEHAHVHGVIHRDLKPENIMLTKNGRVKVMDFGIARSDYSTFKTSTGQVMGTPSYMSPEQVRGDRDLDARSDLYSLGIILYFLSVGRLPFADTNPFALGFKHISEPPPPPREVRPEMPPEMEAIILKSLAKDPKDRYQSAGDFIQALNDLVLYHPEFAADQQTPIPMLPTGMSSMRDDGSTNVIEWDQGGEGRTKTAGVTVRNSTPDGFGPARGATPVAPPPTRPAYPSAPPPGPNPKTPMPPPAMPAGYGYNPGHTTPDPMRSNMMPPGTPYQQMPPSAMGNVPTGPGMPPQMQMMMTPHGMQPMMMTPMPAPRQGLHRSPAVVGAVSSIAVVLVVGALFFTGVIPGLSGQRRNPAETPGQSVATIPGPLALTPGPTQGVPPAKGGEVRSADGRHEPAPTPESIDGPGRNPSRTPTPSPAITVAPQPRTTPEPIVETPTPRPTPVVTPRPTPSPTPTPTPSPTPKPPVPRIERNDSGHPIVIVAPFGDVATSPDPTAGHRLAEALGEEIDPARQQLLLPTEFAAMATGQSMDIAALAASPSMAGALAREAGADFLIAGTIERGAEVVVRLRVIDLRTNKAVATATLSGADMAALMSRVPNAAHSLGVGRMPEVVETPAPTPNVVVVRETPPPTPRPQPTPRDGERFREVKEGVVYDKTLDLYWYCPSGSRKYVYGDAKSACAALSVGGLSSWRLPSEGEVSSFGRDLSEAREFMPNLKVGDSFRYWLHTDTAWFGLAPAFNFDMRSGRIKSHTKDIVATQYQILAVSKD